MSDLQKYFCMFINFRKLDKFKKLIFNLWAKMFVKETYEQVGKQ